MEKISVIVPVYRVEKYLRRCIESIINQDYSNLEIILVDDGSDDSSPQICDYYEKIDSRIIVIHQRNGGLSCARNRGLEVATGDYIGFVDSDDYIERNMYSTLLENIKTSNSDISICGFYTWTEYEKRVVATNNKLSVYNHDEIMKRYFRIDQKKDYFAVWCCLYSRKVTESVRFTEGIINEDVDYKYRVFLNSSRVCETTSMLYAYNVGNISITRMTLSPKDLDLFKAWENVIEYAKNAGEDWQIEAAEFNYVRVNLTLLIKYAMFGIKGFENNESIINSFSKHLRKNLFSILKSRGLDTQRKLAAILCSLQPRLVKRLFDLSVIERKL